MKHTPGPWRIKGRQVEGKNLNVASSGWREVATTYGPTLETQEANARLIAAAPELLDALRAITPLLPENTQQAVEKLLARINGGEAS